MFRWSTSTFWSIWFNYPKFGDIRLYLRHQVNADTSSLAVSDRSDPIRVVLPFKDQASADIVRVQLKDLSQKIQTTVQPVFVNQKIGRDLKLREAKPPIVNQQCVVYKFECDPCDAGYVGFTRRHLHQRRTTC